MTRVVQQLANHNYRTIVLSVYSNRGSIGRFVWTPESRRTEPLPQTPNPCAGGADTR